MKIFVPAGDPEGIRVVEKSNWTGKGIVFPRSLLPEEVRRRKELKLPGVYVLWEAGGSGQLPRTYMGEGNKLLQPAERATRTTRISGPMELPSSARTRA